MERALYDQIGQSYSATRQTDPRLAELIWEALGNAETVLNVGAGSGAYEPRDRSVCTVELSAVMIAQRPAGGARAAQASAQALPFADSSLDAVCERPRPAFRAANPTSAKAPRVSCANG